MALSLVTVGQIVGLVGLLVVFLTIALASLFEQARSVPWFLVCIVGLSCVIYAACENVEIPKS